MQPDNRIAQQAIQLLHDKEQKTARLLELALSQSQALLVHSQRLQDMVAQQWDTIDRLKAELEACRSAQASAFGLVHTN